MTTIAELMEDPEKFADFVKAVFKTKHNLGRE